MLLGLVTQHFLIHMHQLGIALTGDQGAAMTSIHLYNASQKCGQISTALGEWNLSLSVLFRMLKYLN